MFYSLSQVPSQLLAGTAPQPPAEIQYIQPQTLQSGAYVHYQPGGAPTAGRLTQQLAAAAAASQRTAGASQYAARTTDPFQQSLCMSSVILAHNGVPGEWTACFELAIWVQ